MTTKSLTYYNDENDEVTEEFPAYTKTCPCCNGKGERVLPSWQWSHDDRPESVTCERCAGERVITLFDADRMDERQREIVEYELFSNWKHAAESAAERAFGC